MGVSGEDTANAFQPETMNIHVLEQEQVLPITPEEAWSFFSAPRNLDSITPPDCGFRLVAGGDDRLHDGQILTYRIRLAPLIEVSWVTEIRSVDPGRSFIDEQRFGPFKFWHHRHVIEAVNHDTRIHDRVHYAMPFGPLGEIVHALSVRRRLEQIFRHRREVMAERFGNFSS
jgi:ligand-binding SRPBCC domain-containing protein